MEDKEQRWAAVWRNARWASTGEAAEGCGRSPSTPLLVSPPLGEPAAGLGLASVAGGDSAAMGVVVTAAKDGSEDHREGEEEMDPVVVEEEEAVVVGRVQDPSDALVQGENGSCGTAAVENGSWRAFAWNTREESGW